MEETSALIHYLRELGMRAEDIAFWRGLTLAPDVQVWFLNTFKDNPEWAEIFTRILKKKIEIMGNFTRDAWEALLAEEARLLEQQ